MNFLSTKKGNKKNYSETTNDGLKLDSKFFGLRTVQNSSRGAARTLLLHTFPSYFPRKHRFRGEILLV